MRKGILSKLLIGLDFIGQAVWISGLMLSLFSAVLPNDVLYSDSLFFALVLLFITGAHQLLSALFMGIIFKDWERLVYLFMAMLYCGFSSLLADLLYANHLIGDHKTLATVGFFIIPVCSAWWYFLRTYDTFKKLWNF